MPSTKAACDRKIADLQGQLEREKASLARLKEINKRSGCSATGAINSANSNIASIKAEIAKVRAHKKECKS